MNQNELGLGHPGNLCDDQQNNPEDMNKPRFPNNPENVDHQEIPPHVLILPAQPLRDLAVPLTANLLSSISIPPRGGGLN